MSKRQILRETGMHWQTLEKILTNEAPVGYRQRKRRRRPKLGAYVDRIAEILNADKEAPKKQRHTAKRIFERLKEEGYTGGCTQVKAMVRELRRTSREVFVPLVHLPGEAQVDFGWALVKEAGVLRKVALFVMSLPYSNSTFVQAFDRICTETMWEGHVRAFEFFGGVPWRITYDNDGTLVIEVLCGKGRKLTMGLLRLESHYLFDHHFCNVGRPNEKGVVEGDVKFSRLNFLVPVPQVRDMEELNEDLASRCRDDLKRRLRGRKASKEELLLDDQAAFHELPQARFDACRVRSTMVNSLSLVRFDCNDYSVPVRHAHHTVVAKGYVSRVEICRGDEVIATHKRLWGKEEVSFDPLHYLAILERKPGAFDHARPLANWELADCFEILRRRLENERGGEGTREYIGVLRLMETHSKEEVTRAVRSGLRANALTRDAIAQFLTPREDWRSTTFQLDGHPHLRHVRVAATDVAQYGLLLGTGGQA